MGSEAPWGAIATTVAATGLLILVAARLSRRSKAVVKGAITDLHRFAVKGLERDSLGACALPVGGCLPSDRAWALMREDKHHEFDPADPKWVNKMSFFAACSAGQTLAQFTTAYDDESTTLVVRDKHSGKLLLEERLGDPQGRNAADLFFTSRLFEGPGSAAVRLVRAAAGREHQFGNTSSGVEASGDVRTVHLVNRETVRALSEAAGVELDPLVFRANVLFEGVAPWEEFQWVGRRIALGPEVRLRVVKRTVRCAATCVDLGAAARGPDVPGLLQRHFPEHGPYLGVYAQVVRAGTVRVGDDVQPCEWLEWL